MHIVILGNSAAGLSGLEAFRKLDKISRVTVIAKENCRPYSKVLLPYYLREKISYENLFIRPAHYFETMDAKCIQAAASQLEVEERLVILDNGAAIAFDKILIATGASPTKPPIPGLAGEGICHLWTLDDVHRITPYLKEGNRIVVLGSGFVSLQAACAALTRGLKVTVVELLDRIMPRALDDRGAALLAHHLTQAGVDLRVRTVTRKVTKTEAGTYRLDFDDNNTLEADCILVGTGVKPNIDFLRNTPVETDNGIIVNGRMETSVSGIYAAGDVAQVPSWQGGGTVVHALWPTAIETGAAAGRSMASESETYAGSLNMNVTQMFDVTVASIGNFMGVDADETWIDQSLDDDQYLKIVLKNNIPIGATCVGSPKLVTTLGMLRPLIREKIRIAGRPETLRSILAKNISKHHHAFATGRLMHLDFND